jgi:hypothetical protein
MLAELAISCRIGTPRTIRKPVMPLLTETKPRKAKYGFKCQYAGSTILDIGVLVRSTLGKGGPGWWDEVTSNMGQIGYLIYFDDEALYEMFKAANART